MKLIEMVEPVKGDLFLSEEMSEDVPEIAHSMEYNNILNSVFKYDTELQDLFLSLKLKKRQKPFGILDAHGSFEGDWKFEEAGKNHSVQDWVTQHDVAYRAIILCVCNPEDSEVYSDRAVLIYPDDVYCPARVGLDQVKHFSYNFSIPRVGQVDPYTIESYLKEMK